MMNWMEEGDIYINSELDFKHSSGEFKSKISRDTEEEKIFIDFNSSS